MAQRYDLFQFLFFKCILKQDYQFLLIFGIKQQKFFTIYQYKSFQHASFKFFCFFKQNHYGEVEIERYLLSYSYIHCKKILTGNKCKILKYFPSYLMLCLLLFIKVIMIHLACICFQFSDFHSTVYFVITINH